MVTVTICCRHCGSKDVIRNGHASNGKQKYYCKLCKRQSREDPLPNGYTEERKEEITRSYQERSSLRGLTRTFGVARNTVSTWLKKSSKTVSFERNARKTRCELSKMQELLIEYRKSIRKGDGKERKCKDEIDKFVKESQYTKQTLGTAMGKLESNSGNDLSRNAMEIQETSEEEHPTPKRQRKTRR